MNIRYMLPPSLPFTTQVIMTALHCSAFCVWSVVMTHIIPFMWISSKPVTSCTAELTACMYQVANYDFMLTCRHYGGILLMKDYQLIR